MPDLRDRLRGGLFGLLIGDAVGVPYEFHPPDQLPPHTKLDLVPPPGFRRTYPHVPPGTWSDDGALALALLDSLLSCGGLNPEDLGRRFVAWAERGAYAVGGVVFDIGIATGAAVRRLAAGTPALAAGADGERSNGNGALMRTLPLVLWHRGDDAALLTDAMLQSRVTHGHPRSQVCCGLYALWARRILDGGAGAGDPWTAAVASTRQLLGDASRAGDPAARRALDELERHVLPNRPLGGEGYVVTTLQAARHALTAGGYEEVVRAAIALGHDTDTTACVAGGLAGLRDGELAIPERWRQALRGREIVDPLAERLLETVGD
jgi:ADP-ribosyl-[dinitrogen reductase] hydrolase